MPYKQKTPGAVMAAGVLLIVYGSMRLSCGVCGGFGMLVNNPNDDELAGEVPGHVAFEIGETASNLLVGAAMILSGVGVLQLNPTARIGAYVTSIYEIVMAVVHTVYNVVWVFPAMERILALQAQNQPQMAFDIFGMISGGMWITLILGVATTLAFCGGVIYLLSVPSARAAFADEFDGEPPPSNERRRPRYDDYEDDDYAPPKPPSAPGDTGITDRT